MSIHQLCKIKTKQVFFSMKIGNFLLNEKKRIACRRDCGNVSISVVVVWCTHTSYLIRIKSDNSNNYSQTTHSFARQPKNIFDSVQSSRESATKYLQEFFMNGWKVVVPLIYFITLFVVYRMRSVLAYSGVYCTNKCNSKLVQCQKRTQ